MVELSIVIPTFNRAELLEGCLRSLAGTAISYEVIVVDGASTDGTPAVLESNQRAFGPTLRVLREAAREGFVRAANKGFAVAHGRNMMWLNDDARPVTGSLERAIKQLDRADASVGMVALFHRTDATRNIAYETVRRGVAYKLMHVRGTLYANFGIARRETFERLHYFDERFYLNAADPDFSLKLWQSGLRVEPAMASLIDHDEHPDARRAADAGRGNEDNIRLFTKWDLPPRNPEFNDFDPLIPCTLNRECSASPASFARMAG